MRNFIVCAAECGSNPKPRFLCQLLECDVCDCEMWIPESDSDYPIIESRDQSFEDVVMSIEWICYDCYLQFLVDGTIMVGDRTHMLCGGPQ